MERAKIINVDRNITINPDFDGQLVYPELANSGPISYTSADLKNYFVKTQHPYMHGGLKCAMRELQNNGLIEKCLNLQDREAIIEKGMDFFKSLLLDQNRDTVYFWKSVVKRNEIHYVPILTRGGCPMSPNDEFVKGWWRVEEGHYSWSARMLYFN